LHKFCLLDHLEYIRVPGNSKLQRYANWLPAQSMRETINPLLKQAGVNAELAQPQDIEAVFMDTTCVRGKADAEVEFGNVLLLAENRQGVIVDYNLWRESAPECRFEKKRRMSRKRHKIQSQQDKHVQFIGEVFSIEGIFDAINCNKVSIGF
jgi:hypothetical protein